MSITKAKLSEYLVSTMGFDKLTATKFVDEFFNEITNALISGKSVKLSGFGNLVLHNKKGRWVRNPKTKKPVWMAERRVVIFKAGKKLKNTMAQVDLEDNLL